MNGLFSNVGRSVNCNFQCERRTILLFFIIVHVTTLRDSCINTKTNSLKMPENCNCNYSIGRIENSCNVIMYTWANISKIFAPEFSMCATRPTQIAVGTTALFRD